MTKEQNIKEILIWHFNGFKEDIIDRACKRILELEESEEAHWIIYPKNIYGHLVCSNCLSNAPYDCHTNYCPNCGKKMV